MTFIKGELRPCQFQKGNTPWIRGRKVPKEVLEKISKSLKANKYKRHVVAGWNKGLKGAQVAWNKGGHTSEESKEKNRLSHLGKRASLETRKKQSEMRKGSKSALWKGGITPVSQAIRSSFEYKQWRISVFERDNYTCQICHKRGNTTLHADHIKPFALFPELRFEITNGRTLCKECHRATDTYPKNLLGGTR